METRMQFTGKVCDTEQQTITHEEVERLLKPTLGVSNQDRKTLDSGAPLIARVSNGHVSRLKAAIEALNANAPLSRGEEQVLVRKAHVCMASLRNYSFIGRSQDGRYVLMPETGYDIRFEPTRDNPFFMRRVVTKLSPEGIKINEIMGFKPKPII